MNDNINIVLFQQFGHLIFYIDYFFLKWYNIKKLSFKGCEVMAGISNVLYEFVSIIMSILLSLGVIVTPGTDQLITQINADAKLQFVVGGDPQVCNYNPSRETSLIAMCDDIMNAETTLDAFIIAGDIAENGFQDEFDRVKTDIEALPTDHFIMAAGNHDIRLRDYNQCVERFYGFMNSLNEGKENAQIQTQTDKLNYVYDVNGYKFVVMGSDKASFEEAFISDAQLQWLNITLKELTANGDPVFVICHYPLAESHGLPNTWGSANSKPTQNLPTYNPTGDEEETGSIGGTSKEIYDIISSYKNVFFITGHLHTGFGYYTYQTISEENNVQGINVPSMGIDNKDGTYNNPGTAVYVEVTDSKVIFYARDFAQGKYLTTAEFPDAVMEYDIIK